MFPVLVAPLVAQAIVMGIDEGWFHRRRGLPRWERIGHPLDTLTVAIAFASLLFASSLVLYGALAIVSCLFVTKDEAVHARHCSTGEHWLHALLFLLHPVVFIAFAAIWESGAHPMILWVQLGLTVSFGVYQIVYWSLVCKRT